MGRYNGHFVRNTKLFQDPGGSFHNNKIAVASHNNADKRIHTMICSKIRNKEEGRRNKVKCKRLKAKGSRFKAQGTRSQDHLTRSPVNLSNSVSATFVLYLAEMSRL